VSPGLYVFSLAGLSPQGTARRSSAARQGRTAAAAAARWVFAAKQDSLAGSLPQGIARRSSAARQGRAAAAAAARRVFAARQGSLVESSPQPASPLYRVCVWLKDNVLAPIFNCSGTASAHPKRGALHCKYALLK